MSDLPARRCETCWHVTGSAAFPDCDHPSGEPCGDDYEKWEERPTYNHLEVGFRHLPLTQREIEQRLRRTCEEIAQDARAALSATPVTGQPEGTAQADTPTQEKLLAAMLWIDTFEPETTAAAEAKFGFKLIS
ncbi:MAG: hypothetical protein GX567_19770 [Clostridia bacterium]|nr:hypothetical protein [Clostridia bacterium]